jgi:hypothetical protein
MKTQTLRNLLGVGLLTVVLVSGKSQAAYISGSVDMSGTAILDNTLLGSATSATSFMAVSVGGIPTGAFAGTAGDSVTWSAFGWNPSTTPVTPLWTYFDGGTGWTYTFDLLTISVDSQDNKFLNLLGSGMLTITGAGSPYVATPGQWSFTISNPGGGSHANFAFTFANSQTAVPDGGTTLTLLGLGVGAVELIRRRYAACRCA